ncbi:MAG TPA: DOMON-like domain-containing protein [Ottowia sp.]|uniref:DOMON-like domain-containing protein n=1 Tax=Ottowia sp. TaxID=1898956 RepID=UPI002BEE21BE|nr:DOMON-like domain-containing protein [Ottowia sp.]HMN21430.1 DOMON-like domain-containing protein [Ottowia sp.]
MFPPSALPPSGRAAPADAADTPDARMHRLVAHPDTPCAAVHRLQAQVAAAPAGGGWMLCYVLQAELAGLRLPPTSPAPGAADGLWRHTCLEAFVGSTGDTAYLEFNFSPSGDWAAYAFRAPRERAGTQHVPPPRLRWTRGPHVLALEAWLPRALLSCLPRTPDRLGLSAVIEQVGGQLSYWALAHPAARPDFHQRAGWTAGLPALATTP